MAGKYIVYADESGNQSLRAIEPNYPVFILAMCVFEVESYVNRVVPAFQKLKFKWFGHDMTIFHSYDIRRKRGSFAFLNDPKMYKEFHADLAACIEQCEFQIVYELIDRRLGAQERVGLDVYEVAASGALTKLERLLFDQGEAVEESYIVFESRGAKQDHKLRDQIVKLGWTGKLVFASKLSVSTGLQIADLIARPIGMKHVAPLETNAAFDVISKKIYAIGNSNLKNETLS
jgi:hypothetical protein